MRGSPIKRIGRDRFVRNVLIAIGNSRDISLAPSAETLLGDLSPLVRAMAVWALAQLLDTHAFAELVKEHATNETDADVLTEWSSGLGRVTPN
jgi:epoxyqueuosine reductase